MELNAIYLELAELAYLVFEGIVSPKDFLSKKKEIDVNLNK